jgi:predicted nucleic acid-binding protein
LTDLLVAHIAKKNNLEVVSLDLHFDQVPGLQHRKPPF